MVATAFFPSPGSWEGVPEAPTGESLAVVPAATLARFRITEGTEPS